MKVIKKGESSLQKNTNMSILGINTLSVITLICMLILTSCSDDDSNVQESTLSQDIANQEFVKIIEKNVSGFPKNTQIAIAIIDNESTEFIGIINDNHVLRGIDNADKIFEIGSITKVFAGICLSKLIASNEAVLTETLQSQFDFPLKNGGDINLLQLANHTSGLPRLPSNGDEIIDFDPKDPYASYTIPNLESYYQNHVVLNSSSGTKYEYSNLGAGTLGYILSKKKETSFEGLLQSLIFEPLQMTSSTTQLENVDTSKLVIGQDPNGNVAPNWNFTDPMAAAGSIKSSVIDLEKFVRKNFEDDPVYNLAQQKTFIINQNYSIGLGWFTIENDGYKRLWHNGGTGGYSSDLLIDKNNKKAVIVLSNVYGLDDTSEKITELGSDLLENITFE